ncbi:hypothetical protein [Povalibacter sp.]
MSQPDIQSRMFAELRSKDIFELAQRSGLDYVDAASSSSCGPR